jgi:threonine dehydratase
MELFEEAGELDALFVPLGGGGLLGGTALATRALAPRCKLYGVEPETGNDAQQSLRKGEIVHIATPKTIADGAQTQHLGNLTFPILKRDVDDVLTASDDQLVACMRFLGERMKMIVEPTGCLGFAGAWHAGVPIEGKRVGVILSGGNVDLVRFAQLIGGMEALDPRLRGDDGMSGNPGLSPTIPRCTPRPSHFIPESLRVSP